MSKRVGQARSGASNLTYHEFNYPWTSEATPFAKELEVITRQWVLDRGLLQLDEASKRYDPLNIGLLASLTYPEAPPDKLLVIAAFLSWIFIQDDYYDNILISLDPNRLQRKVDMYVSVVNGEKPSPDANSVIIALAEVIERIENLAAPSWMHRFARSMHDFWTNGIVGETRFRTQGIVPNIDAYMRMRLYSIGVLPVLYLVEFSQGFTLPDHVIKHPSIQQLWQLTAQIIIYTNDVLSYQKERRVSDPNNLIHVLMHHEGVSFPVAVDHAVRMHNKDLQDFMSLADALPDWGPEVAPLVNKYIAGHRAWIRGALDWQTKSGRYATGRDYLESTATSSGVKKRQKPPKARQ
jgi:hypothetical protein